MNTDEILSAILRAEADAVEVGPEAFEQIRVRVAARRRRRVWWRGGLAVAGALSVVATAAVVLPDRNAAVRVPPASPAPSTTAAPNDDNQPLDTAWPLLTRGELRAYQADPSGFPYLADPVQTVTEFARVYLGIPDPQVKTIGVSAGAYEVSRQIEGSDQSFPVSTVLVQSFGENRGAPWLVVGAQHDAISVATPRSGELIAPGATVSGTTKAIDVVISVSVRETRSGTSTELVRMRATQSPEGWTAGVKFPAPSEPAGSLLVTTDSGADGGLASATVVPVRLGRDIAGPDTPPDGPASFFGVANGRVGRFASGAGKLEEWLTDVLPGGGPSDLAFDASKGYLYWSQGTGTCSASIQSRALSGDPVQTLVSDERWVLRHPVPLYGGPLLAYLADACDTDEVEVRLLDRDTGRTRTLYETRGDGLTLSGDLSTLLLIGAGGDLVVLDTGTVGKAWRRVAPRPNCDWTAAMMSNSDGAAPVYAALRCGQRSTLVNVNLDDGTITDVISLGERYITHLDITDEGAYMLLAWMSGDTLAPVDGWDGQGAIYRISDSGPEFPVW